MVALEAVLAETKAAHARLVDISARAKADVTEARADLGKTNICLGKVEQEAMLASATTDETREQFVKSAKTTKSVTSSEIGTEAELSFFSVKSSFDR